MTHPVWRERDAWPPMIVAVTGASGLIGGALVAALEQRGVTVRRLVRRAPSSASEFRWDPERGEIDATAVNGADAVVHLAGESLAHRWTAARKRAIRDSRVQGTETIARAVAAASPRPRVLLSGSAIGVYGSRGDEILDESSGPGGDFLALVCQKWEAATAPAEQAGARVVHLRTGIVLSARGGALQKMLMPFKLGFGGRLGSGEQWASWISLDDEVGAILALLRDDVVSGPVNLVAPNPVTNAEFTRTLANVVSRPAILPVPSVALKALFGAEMADETVLASQRVRPRRLLEAGFDFRHSTLGAALRATLGD